jgi:hypothetical protein
MGQGEQARGFREKLELWSAVLLAIATVATAYSAYESSRWSGQQSTQFTSAGASRTESAKAQSNGASFVTIDAGLFTQFAAAFTEDNKQLQNAIEGFFREEFRPAFEEWIALDPLKNPDAPPTPFQLDSYVEAQSNLIEADELEEEATAKFEAGREANQTSDNYVLATIFFAAVLFFSGIATKFTSDRIVAGTLAVGTTVFIGGVARVATLPFL